MALYWPDRKVALQIDDDPASKPFDGPDDWEVIHATASMFEDFTAFDTLMGRLAHKLGEEVDQGNREKRRALFERLSSSTKGTEPDGHVIVDLRSGEVSDWNERVPEGSFHALSDGTMMSTPEFFYLREARKRTLGQEMQLAYELCGLYSMDHGTDRPVEYELYEDSVTSIDELRDYLAGARGLEGYQRAMKALDYAVEGSISPAASYLAILLTTPRSLGGYDLVRPRMGQRFLDPLTAERMPTEDGRYEFYDLCWPRQHVALQFVGDRQPNPRERRALEAPGLADMFVVCVTSRQMRDAEAFEEAARLVGERLGTPIPPTDAAFARARDLLREEMDFPECEHMRAMSEDFHWHEGVVYHEKPRGHRSGGEA